MVDDKKNRLTSENKRYLGCTADILIAVQNLRDAVEEEIKDPNKFRLKESLEEFDQVMNASGIND